MTTGVLNRKVTFVVAIAIAFAGWIILAACNSGSPNDDLWLSPSYACAESDNYQDCVDAHDFSGSILIAKDWDVIYEIGVGIADTETGRKNTPETVYRIGSITKQFTAVLILMLQEQGLLSVDDTIDKFDIEYPYPTDITIHQLLNHTAGVPNYVTHPELPAMLADPDLTTEEAYAVWKDMLPQSPPGATLQYSNGGYHLLGMIIEDVTGRGYEELVEDWIFQPLAMENSGYGAGDFSELNAAYSFTEESGQQTFLNHEIPYSSGALVSSVRDLFKWDQALFNNEVLKLSSLDQILTPHEGEFGYGYGLSIGDSYSHGGSIAGYSTDRRELIGFSAAIKSYWPDDQVMIVVLSNHNNVRTVRELSDSLRKMVNRNYPDIP